jgi:uncharacterized membrane protein YbaN (DUF454 family)
MPQSCTHDGDATIFARDRGGLRVILSTLQETTRTVSPMPTRILWLILGFLSIACGIVGIVLPLVPTTPFLLLAALAFARSSPSLHNWLVTHPRLGPPITEWRAHGAINRRAKIVAVVVMGATLSLSAAMGVGGTVLLVQAGVLCMSAAFVLTRPDGPSSKQ